MITFRRWLWQKFKNAMASFAYSIRLAIKSLIFWGFILLIIAIVAAFMNKTILWLISLVTGLVVIITSWLYEAYKEEVNRVGR